MNTKREKQKMLRWSQPFANAKMEDLYEVLSAVRSENLLFRKLLISKGIIAENEHENFFNEFMKGVNNQEKATS